MKVLVVILALGIFACSNASPDTPDLLDHTSSLISGLLETATGTVNSLVDQAKGFVQKILSGAWSGSLIGKREEEDSKKFFEAFISKFQNLLDHGKAGSTKLFKKAMERLQYIAEKFHKKLAQLTDSKDVADEIDDVVAEHNKVQKRFVQSLIEKAKSLWTTAKASAKALFSKAASAVVQAGGNLLVGKREGLSFSDHIQKLGNHLQTLVSPFKDVVSDLGNTLKGHFSNLIDTAKGHVTALGNKLKGHLGDLSNHGKTLAEHGKNAISAIGEVVNDVLQQTLANAKPSIDGIIQTAGDAGKVVAGHFAGNN